MLDKVIELNKGQLSKPHNVEKGLFLDSTKRFFDANNKYERLEAMVSSHFTMLTTKVKCAYKLEPISNDKLPYNVDSLDIMRAIIQNEHKELYTQIIAECEKYFLKHYGSDDMVQQMQNACLAVIRRVNKKKKEIKELEESTKLRLSQKSQEV